MSDADDHSAPPGRSHKSRDAKTAFCTKAESGNHEEFVLKGDIALETDLRKLITPDHVCGWEAMVAGEWRLSEAGLEKHGADLADLPLERLRMCAAMLPPGEVASHAGLLRGSCWCWVCA